MKLSHFQEALEKHHTLALATDSPLDTPPKVIPLAVYEDSASTQRVYAEIPSEGYKGSVHLDLLIGEWGLVERLRERARDDRAMQLAAVSFFLESLLPNGGVVMGEDGRFEVQNLAGAARDIGNLGSSIADDSQESDAFGLDIACADCNAAPGESCDPFCPAMLGKDADVEDECRSPFFCDCDDCYRAAFAGQGEVAL